MIENPNSYQTINTTGNLGKMNVLVKDCASKYSYFLVDSPIIYFHFIEV